MMVCMTSEAGKTQHYMIQKKRRKTYDRIAHGERRRERTKEMLLTYERYYLGRSRGRRPESGREIVPWYNFHFNNSSHHRCPTPRTSLEYSRYPGLGSVHVCMSRNSRSGTKSTYPVRACIWAGIFNAIYSIRSRTAHDMRGILAPEALESSIEPL